MTAAHKVADKNLDDLRVRCGVWDIKVKVEKTERHNDMRETERQR